jgi:broad specificity phosphatase PhoE
VRQLVLIRHSQPEIVPYDLAAVVASREPKAVETGQIVARALGLPFETAADLHEHDRPNVGLLADEEQFQARVASVFEHPGELVFGRETADEAHVRFTTAIANVMAQHPRGNLAVVTHGTVMTLFVARAAGLDPVPFWKRFGLPAFVVLSLPGFGLVEVVESVGRET